MPGVSGLGTPVLMLAFAAAGAATWIAGIVLSKATDALDVRLSLGDAVGGMILLAIAGSLPEVAITVTAAAAGNLGLASGNLIGGIAVQTLVLVLCDAVASRDLPLTFLAGSLLPLFEGLLVIVVVVMTVAGGLLRTSVAIGPVSPASLMIVLLWLGGMGWLNLLRKNPRWRAEAPGGHPGRPHRRVRHPQAKHPFEGRSTAAAAGAFGLASLVTLVAGVILADAGGELAGRAGINGVIFGATILAAVTALPEISSGIAAAKLGDYQLVMGDIFGGNAFQVCLFVVADLVAGGPVLPHQGGANSWVGGLGVIMTAVYAAGIIARPGRTFARLGIDSILVLVLFALGIAGLVAVHP
jgi:cation:H+ antiporter